MEGEYVVYSDHRYVVNLYCFVVQDDFYSNMVELWPVTQVAYI